MGSTGEDQLVLKLPIPGKRNILITSALSYVNNVPYLGNIIEMLADLVRREETANIKLDPDVDVFMKVVSTQGKEKTMITYHIIKVLGLEICADTMVGNDMIKGISGGQRKRLMNSYYD